jgi:ribosomal-protein-serine acetyltransferase
MLRTNKPIKMETPINISSDIRLSQLNITDASQILALVDANRSQLEQFLYWVQKVNCENTARDYIQQRVDSGLPQAQWFKIIFKNKPSGVFAIKSVSAKGHVAELGYWLSADAQGYRVISSIILQLPQLLGESGAKIIEFRCLSENVSSIAVAENAGARLVKSRPNFMTINELSQDLNIYRAEL